jgi:hypothetical protein
MKKFFTLVATILVTLSFVGCGSSDDDARTLGDVLATPSTPSDYITERCTFDPEVTYPGAVMTDFTDVSDYKTDYMLCSYYYDLDGYSYIVIVSGEINDRIKDPSTMHLYDWLEEYEGLGDKAFFGMDEDTPTQFSVYIGGYYINAGIFVDSEIGNDERRDLLLTYTKHFADEYK